MLLPFPSKKALRARVLDKTQHKLRASTVIQETSIFGNELHNSGTFAICLDHPRRSKFAEIVVQDGYIVSVK